MKFIPKRKGQRRRGDKNKNDPNNSIFDAFKGLHQGAGAATGDSYRDDSSLKLIGSKLIESFNNLINEAKGSADTAAKKAARMAKKEHKAKMAAKRNKASGPALTALMGDKPRSNRKRANLLRAAKGDTKSRVSVDDTKELDEAKADLLLARQSGDGPTRKAASSSDPEDIRFAKVQARNIRAGTDQRRRREIHSQTHGARRR